MAGIKSPARQTGRAHRHSLSAAIGPRIDCRTVLGHLADRSIWPENGRGIQVMNAPFAEDRFLRFADIWSANLLLEFGRTDPQRTDTARSIQC